MGLQRADPVRGDLEWSGAALGYARAVILEVKHDRVFACGEWLIARPSGMQQCEHVVVEHRYSLEHVQPIPAPASAFGDDHAVAVFRNLDICRDLERPVQDARRISSWDAGHLARIGKDGLS